MAIRYEQILEATDFVFSKIGEQPEIAIILGTGLGGVAERITPKEIVPYDEIPNFKVPTVKEHLGRLIFGTLANKSVIAMQGRFHYYEGYELDQITLPVRVLSQLGTKILIINSAVGGLSPRFRAGDVIVIDDHINLIGQNPLRGVTDPRFGERFPDMGRPYDPELIELAESAAMSRNIKLHKGVYAGVAGPSLETRAETRMLKLLGADCVGMSTIPEVITAVQEGFRIMAIAAITNVNLPDCMEEISLDQVIANAKVAESKIAAIIEEVISRID